GDEARAFPYCSPVRVPHACSQRGVGPLVQRWDKILNKKLTLKEFANLFAQYSPTPSALHRSIILHSGLKQRSHPRAARAGLEFGHLTSKYLLRNEILSELLKP